jgi:RNA polymerase sigma factor (sigma-70 family)
VSDDGPKPPPDPPDPGDGENPGEVLFRNNLETIDRAIRFVCGRHRLMPEEAEDFASHARLELMANGYARLRKFRRESELATFLVTTTSRILLDVRNAAWGKWRSSAEALRIGPPAPLIEQLIVRDGYSADEAFEMLRTNCGVDIPRAGFEAILTRLPVRVRRRFESEEALANVASGDSADRDVVDEEERLAAEALSQALQEELAALPAQDRLLIRLSEEDGLPMRQVGEIMGCEAPALFRRRERIRAHIRKRLKERGFGREEGPG